MGGSLLLLFARLSLPFELVCLFVVPSVGCFVVCLRTHNMASFSFRFPFKTNPRQVPTKKRPTHVSLQPTTCRLASSRARSSTSRPAVVVVSCRVSKAAPALTTPKGVALKKTSPEKSNNYTHFDPMIKRFGLTPILKARPFVVV